MKKSTSLLLTATALLFLTFSEGRAQTAKKTEIKTFESEALMTSGPINTAGLSALGKAEKVFTRLIRKRSKWNGQH